MEGWWRTSAPSDPKHADPWHALHTFSSSAMLALSKHTAGLFEVPQWKPSISRLLP